MALGCSRMATATQLKSISTLFATTSPLMRALLSPQLGFCLPAAGNRLSFSTAAVPTTNTRTRDTNMQEVMLQKLQEEACINKTNFVCSPLSLNMMMNMVAAGTKGRTLEQMLHLVGSKTIENLNSNSSKIMNVANNNKGTSENNSGDKGGPNISFINGVWVDHRFPLVPSYREVVSRLYSAETKVVDFQSKADEAVHEVNLWAEAASRGLITNILSPRNVSPDTAIILANGLYFKGTWSDKFDSQCTVNRDFFLLNGDSVSVPFMTNYGKRYQYGSFEGIKVLKIPYQIGKVLNKRFAMYFFLPEERDGLQGLLKEFDSNPGFLQQEKLNLRAVKFDEFWIPKFKFSYGFDVCEATREMGLSMPFLENSADFSGMVHVPEEGLPFLVSNILHKAFIEVDEKGTEAVAISVFTGLGGCARFQEERPSFIADHPFLFMIKEETSGLDFFTGAVVNPMTQY